MMFVLRLMQPCYQNSSFRLYLILVQCDMFTIVISVHKNYHFAKFAIKNKRSLHSPNGLHLE